ncbi:MAG: cadmium-translocating P-type ATPase [Oscillospiraceae bacterium]|nr:cadmium-translocating P-type ATPase [Oscillospiraceae bacterium]
MKKAEKLSLIRITVSAVLLVILHFIRAEGWIRLSLYLLPYLIVGYDVLLKACRGIARGQVFDESFLMALATVGAFAIGEYPEAVFVMLFFQVGELFEHLAVGKSRRSIAALMDIRPDTANLETENGIEETDPEEVAVGSVIVIRPGERVPIDGEVIEGESSLDTAALTGESLPRGIRPGEAVVSGSVNMTATLRVRTTKEFGDSTVSKILDLVENSASNKAKSESFITRFARWYTPAVVGAALLLALVPPLFDGQWYKWIHQALTFLVISCPCALVLSVPLSFFGGIGGASRQGILVKGSNYLEDLGKTETVLFDKTGTLTKGSFAVTRIASAGADGERLIDRAAHAECDSTHPIAESIRRAFGKAADRSRVENVEEHTGRGVSAVVDGAVIRAGNALMMKEAGIDCGSVKAAGTVVHVSENGDYLGHIVISDEIKPESASVISELKKRSIRTVMLTGDRAEVGESVAGELGLDAVHSELLPADKVKHVEEELKNKSPNGKVVFAGDGINDAPVLARADLGIAMGALGSDAAIEAADIVLMDDDLNKLTKAIDISRRTNRIVRENIIFALAVKAVVLILGLLGRATMWAAVFADVGVLVICVLNAMRTLKTK